MDYRSSVSETMSKDNTEVRLKQRQAECEQAFLQAMKLPVGDKARLQAICSLAQVRWQQMKFDEAERLYKLAVSETRHSRNYDQTLVNSRLRLAAVFRDENKLKEAESIYLSVWQYDKQFLTAENPRLGRDLTNLGLNSYLEACRQNRGAERTALMVKANDYLEQAVKFYAQMPEEKQHLSIALFNQYLVLRDLGLINQAKTVKEKAEFVDLAFNRSCHAP